MEPSGKLTTGEGTPPPVTAMAVDTGTSKAEVLGAGAIAKPVVVVTLKLSEPPGRPTLSECVRYIVRCRRCVIVH